MQSFDDGHGQDDNHEVGDNVEPRVRKPGRLLVDTRAFPAAPPFLDGRADEDTSRNGGHGVGYDDGDEGPAPDLEFTSGEDALVL